MNCLEAENYTQRYQNSISKDLILVDSSIYTARMGQRLQSNAWRFAGEAYFFYETSLSGLKLQGGHRGHGSVVPGLDLSAPSKVSNIL